MENKVYKTLTEFMHSAEFYERKWKNNPEGMKSLLTNHYHALKQFGGTKDEIISCMLKFVAAMVTEPDTVDENYPAINFMNGQTD